jgi:hypothetical protein
VTRPGAGRRCWRVSRLVSLVELASVAVVWRFMTVGGHGRPVGVGLAANGCTALVDRSRDERVGARPLRPGHSSVIPQEVKVRVVSGVAERCRGGAEDDLVVEQRDAHRGCCRGAATTGRGEAAAVAHRLNLL